MNTPLILTLTLDDGSFRYFNELRQQHFPAERNFLEAHLTLFHHLPGAEQLTIEQYLEEICQSQTVISLPVTEVKMIGRGVAFRLESEALLALHQRLATHWHTWLTPQDRQKLWPHVTVQNKVSPPQARKLQALLSQDFEPFTARGEGLTLWAYQNGPWEHLRTFRFASA